MSKAKEKTKNKGFKAHKEFDRILEFLFSGQNGMEKLEKECAIRKKKWFFAQ